MAMAIKNGYTKITMDVSVAEAKNRLPKLIRAVEQGEAVVITRNGKPVAGADVTRVKYWPGLAHSGPPRTPRSTNGLPAEIDALLATVT